MLAGVDLPVHQPADRALDRSHLTEGFPHRGNLIGAGRLRNFAAQAEQKTHLRPVAYVRLVISEAMARRLDVDVPCEQRVVVHEHLLPRHLDVVAQHHAVTFIVAPGEWGIEFRCDAEHRRLARPECEARRVARYGAGDRLFLLVRRERKHVADPDFVGIDRAGREHLHARDHDAVVFFPHHPQRRHRKVLPLIEFRIARRLRRQHGVDDVDVVVPDVAVIPNEIVGVRTGCRQRVGLDHHAGDERGDVIGRAAEHAEGRVGDPAMSQHAPLQVLARARAQEIDRVATSLLLVGQGVAVRRIRLHVVEGGDRRGGVAKGGMTGDVVDPLAADIDDTAVAQRFQMLFARAQHRPLLV